MRRTNHVNHQMKKSWFWRMFLNNKTVTFLVIVLLVLINILIFTRIGYLFNPILQFLNLVGFPFVATVILYYLFEPIVNRMTLRGIDKRVAIFTIFIVILLLISWGLSFLVPVIQAQTRSFIENIPTYRETINRMLDESIFWPATDRLFPNLSDFFTGFDLSGVTEQLNPILTSTFGSLGSVLGTITQVVTGIFIIPILLYYLLVEDKKIPETLLYYVPTKYRTTVNRMMYQGNYQVSQYIRGQILVATIVGIMFGFGYLVIGLDYGITLAVLAGILNIIPYLGSFIAIIPALIVGLLTSPTMLVKVVIVLVIEQTIEGRFVSPQILGNSMKIHPITILLILLGAGRLFGVSGVILGVPGYAIIKVVLTELYEVYRERSGLYQDDELPVPLQTEGQETFGMDETDETVVEYEDELNQTTE